MCSKFEHDKEKKLNTKSEIKYIDRNYCYLRVEEIIEDIRRLRGDSE